MAGKKERYTAYLDEDIAETLRDAHGENFLQIAAKKEHKRLTGKSVPVNRRGKSLMSDADWLETLEHGEALRAEGAYTWKAMDAWIRAEKKVQVSEGTYARRRNRWLKDAKESGE